MAAANNILIAGIGNIFLGDDAFGSEVARRLLGRSWPEGVRVVDFGIRGLDLVYALLEGYELTILIDATPQGGPPGALYVIEPELPATEEAAAEGCLIDGHTMNPMNVLRLARSMGASAKRILLVGCEPAELGGEDGQLGLSEPVQAALEDACQMVVSLVADHLQPIESAATGGSQACTANMS